MHPQTKGLLEGQLPGKSNSLPILMHVMLILLVLRFFMIVSGFIKMITCTYCEFVLLKEMITVLSLIAIPAACYLGWRKHTWGWILLYAIAWHGILEGLITAWLRMMAGGDPHFFSLMFRLLLMIPMLFILSRSHIMELYHANKGMKRNTRTTIFAMVLVYLIAFIYQ